MEISQLRATATPCWVTCQHQSQGRLEGTAVQHHNHVYRFSLDITCCPGTPPFLSTVLAPKAIGMTASTPSQLCARKLFSVANIHLTSAFGLVELLSSLPVLLAGQMHLVLGGVVSSHNSKYCSNMTPFLRSISLLTLVTWY